MPISLAFTNTRSSISDWSRGRAYLLGLHERFAALAEHPILGRSAQELAPTELAPNLRRFEYQSHNVFYVAKKQGVRIVRVLHQNIATNAPNAMAKKLRYLPRFSLLS